MGLRLVLLGTGEFAVPPFRALIESDHQVLAVYTQPDRSGRGHHRHINVVKQLGESNGLPVMQPERVNTPDVLETLRNFSADAFIVAAYGQILKPEFLAIPRLGAFNLHGSLLPRHRGAAPVQYAIWKGDRRTGVTIFQIEPALDSGPMIGRIETDIGAQETSGQLMMRLADLSVPLTLEAVGRLQDGTAVFERQDTALVTLAPKIPKEAGVIQWSQTAEQIGCHIRAMQPWPKATAWLHRAADPPLRCLLLHTTTENIPQDIRHRTAAAGTIAAETGELWVATGGGWLQVQQLQPEGRKPMDARAFMNGYSVSSGHRFCEQPDH